MLIFRQQTEFTLLSILIGKEMTKTVLQKIKRQFAQLQLNIRSAMEAHGVKVSDVHQFLLSFFQGVCADIPEVSDLTKLFNFVTKSLLWRYDHYGPLKEIVAVFLPADHPARKRVVEYHSQFSGFLTTTKIICLSWMTLRIMLQPRK